VDYASAKTLTSNLTQQFQAVFEDVEITESFEGQLSQQKSFVQTLYKFWVTLPAITGWLIWSPLDMTDKIYRVRIISLTVGGEEMDWSYVGTSIPEKWLTGAVELKMKLLPTLPPSVTMFGHGVRADES
jgi:hypothetical protein